MRGGRRAMRPGAQATADPQAARRLRALTAAMMQPDFYPHATGRIELKQTHISCVFIAGAWVYKIKKTVRFDFLDCSTLARRFHFCREEARLNARLSSGIYDGVYAIISGDGGYALGPRTDRPVPGAIEYAVRMRRLPDDRMLDRMVAADAVGHAAVRKIAARIAAFHAAAPKHRSMRYGSPIAVRKTIEDNLAGCERFAGDTLSSRDLAAIRAFCFGFIDAHRRTIADRARRGRVREGHGDLRTEHVCLRGGKIDIIDCVEFSERLRYGDVASDLAFLAMDLDRLGARGLSDELIHEYVTISGDEELESLLPLYKCYRAMVRGKVESLRSREPEIGAAGRRRARELARRGFALALGYARDARPAMLVVCGRSGTGKSTIARRLRLHTGFEIVSSDAIRKQLARIPAQTRSRAGYREGIYSDRFTRRTYAALLRTAGKILRAGRGAILDATFKDPADRQSALKMAARLGVPALFIECTVAEKEAIRRLSARMRARRGVSDATPAIYRRQREEFVPITEIAPRNHLVVDTTRDGEKIDAAISAAQESR
jgi:uncharacterized protein